MKETLSYSPNFSVYRCNLPIVYQPIVSSISRQVAQPPKLVSAVSGELAPKVTKSLHLRGGRMKRSEGGILTTDTGSLLRSEPLANCWCPKAGAKPSTRPPLIPRSEPPLDGWCGGRAKPDGTWPATASSPGPDFPPPPEPTSELKAVSSMASPRTPWTNTGRPRATDKICRTPYFSRCTNRRPPQSGKYPNFNYIPSY